MQIISYTEQIIKGSDPTQLETWVGCANLTIGNFTVTQFFGDYIFNWNKTPDYKIQCPPFIQSLCESHAELVRVAAENEVYYS